MNQKYTKHTICECKRKFDYRKYNSNQKWNNNKCWSECKNHIREKDYIWSPTTCSCENGKYLSSKIDDSVITCDELIDVEETKTNFNEKKVKSVTFNKILRYFTCPF